VYAEAVQRQTSVGPRTTAGMYRPPYMPCMYPPPLLTSLLWDPEQRQAVVMRKAMEEHQEGA